MPLRGVVRGGLRRELLAGWGVVVVVVAWCSFLVFALRLRLGLVGGAVALWGFVAVEVEVEVETCLVASTLHQMWNS